MRKLFLTAAVLLLAGLACQLPNLGNIKGTIGEIQKTVVTGITEIPKTVEAGATELSASPAVSAEGTIRGHLSYPSEFLPGQTVVAFDVATMTAAAQVTTVDGQAEYELTVPAGDYYVVAYLPDGSLSAGYSQAVPCGLLDSCTDHSLIPVHVGGGAVVENIDPQDWYADPGTFPPLP
jgi:hypothetical protein